MKLLCGFSGAGFTGAQGVGQVDGAQAERIGQRSFPLIACAAVCGAAEPVQLADIEQQTRLIALTAQIQNIQRDLAEQGYAVFDIDRDPRDDLCLRGAVFSDVHAIAAFLINFIVDVLAEYAAVADVSTDRQVDEQLAAPCALPEAERGEGRVQRFGRVAGGGIARAVVAAAEEQRLSVSDPVAEFGERDVLDAAAENADIDIRVNPADVAGESVRFVETDLPERQLMAAVIVNLHAVGFADGDAADAASGQQIDDTGANAACAGDDDVQLRQPVGFQQAAVAGEDVLRPGEGFFLQLNFQPVIHSVNEEAQDIVFATPAQQTAGHVLLTGALNGPGFGFGIFADGTDPFGFQVLIAGHVAPAVYDMISGFHPQIAVEVSRSERPAVQLLGQHDAAVIRHVHGAVEQADEGIVIIHSHFRVDVQMVRHGFILQSYELLLQECSLVNGFLWG